MASGTITGSTNNEHIDAKVEWTSTANNSNNTSSVTAVLYYKRNNTGFQTYGSGSFAITINGKTTRVAKTITITNSAWVEAVRATVTVNHNGDGTKSITISATGSITGTTFNSTTLSGTAKLDLIARASTISSVPAYDVILGETYGGSDGMSVVWTPLNTSFRYKLKFTLGSWSSTTAVIHPEQTSAYEHIVSLPLEVANQIPNAIKGTMTVTLYTYSNYAGTTQVGEPSSKTFTVKVPNDTTTRPSVSMTCNPVSDLSNTVFSGVYIQGVSRAKVSISATGKYNASIASYGLTALSKGYEYPLDSVAVYTEHLETSGTVAINGRAKDSRGFVTEISQNITVIPYSKPKLVPKGGNAAVVCSRCDTTGKLSETGTFLRIAAGRNYSPVMSGINQTNFCSLRYRYKAEGANSYSSYVTLLDRTNTSTNEVDVVLGNIVSSTTTSYMVELSVVDDIGGVTAVTFHIATEQVAFNLKEGGDGAAFGKYAERSNALEIAPSWDMFYKGGAIEQKFYSLRGNTKIPSGADLNSYLTPDVYAIAADDHATNIANMPPYKRAGLLIVYAGTGQDTVHEGTWKYVIQEYRSVVTTIPTYRRVIYSNAEGAWTYDTWQMEKGLDTGWVELTRSGNASTPTVIARGGAGCFYRVINENHVFVRFNCAFTFNGNSINLNSATIPERYRPKYNAYAMCPVNDRAIARASVAADGYIYVNAVQNMATATTTTSFTVNWIDGYIDYWI